MSSAYKGEGGRLEGKTALIINAWFGAGLATAKLFAEQGAEVIITASTQRHLDQALAQIGTCAVGFISQPKRAGQQNTPFSQPGFRGIDMLCVFPAHGELAVSGHVTSQDLDKVASGVGVLFLTVLQVLPFLNQSAAIILTGPGGGSYRNPGFALNDATYALEKQVIRTHLRNQPGQNIRLNFLSFHDGPEDVNLAGSERYGSIGEAELIAANALYLALPECRLNGLEVYMDGHCQVF